jgi:hypothetical protein
MTWPWPFSLSATSGAAATSPTLLVLSPRLQPPPGFRRLTLTTSVLMPL